METWLPVKGYEGYYEVSDSGNIRRIMRPQPYYHERSRMYRVKYKGRLYTLCRDPDNVRSEMAAWHVPELWHNVLKPFPDSDGYMRVDLHVGGIGVHFSVHRLVAEAFLPTPLEGQDEVNHRDSNPLNNNDWNLEWCTHQENMTHWKESRANGVPSNPNRTRVICTASF